LDLAILATVSAGPSYGLAIIQHLEASTDLVINEGTIYPILGRLTRQGWMATSWVANESPHPRKYYRLTAAGKTHLLTMTREWREFSRKIDRLLTAAGKE
jgi:PadR family transcriptional regulator PadR